MKIPERVTTAAFLAIDIMSFVLVVCFFFRTNMTQPREYAGILWRSCRTLVYALAFLIPSLLGSHARWSGRDHILTFMAPYRFYDVSILLLIAFWMLLVVGLLLTSWIGSVSQGLD